MFFTLHTFRFITIATAMEWPRKISVWLITLLLDLRIGRPTTPPTVLTLVLMVGSTFRQETLDFLRPQEAMDVNCRFVEAAWSAYALTALVLNYFPTAPAIFWPCPPAPCSTSSAGTIPTMEAGGMYAFTTSAGWTTMATPGFI